MKLCSDDYKGNLLDDIYHLHGKNGHQIKEIKNELVNDYLVSRCY